jgi:hypothetical protein
MKKSRLLEIIREEIGAVLSEVGQSPEEAKATNLAIQAEKAKIAAAQKQLQQLQKTGVSEVTLEEDTLNEMAYDIIISQPNELAKLQDKIKDSTKKGEQKLAKALEIIQKTKKAGKPIRQRDIANEMGVIQQEINPLINKLIDVGILEKGESVTGVTKKKVTDKAQGRPTGEPKEKPSSTGKKGRPAGAPKAEKVATRTPGDDGFDNVEYSDDEESAAATKAAGSDETAKELASTPEEKKIKFNQFLASVKKNKDDKAKIDGILKLAKDKFKFAKSMMDDLKRAAGREVEA